MNRQYLTTSQRAIMVAKIAREAVTKESALISERSPNYRSELESRAKEMRVGRGIAWSALRVLASEDTELIAKVESGQTSVNAAYRQIRGPKKIQK
ncbi:MAG: hypothetical protein KF752_17815 [Pirellulaceae bacterium]|nr:hypothetical protein [Pirellulaceae bacterium]